MSVDLVAVTGDQQFELGPVTLTDESVVWWMNMADTFAKELLLFFQYHSNFLDHLTLSLTTLSTTTKFVSTACES